MRRDFYRCWLWCGCCLLAGITTAAEPSAMPKPVPRTRRDMKQALEALKSRTPRLPLPKEAGTTPDGRPVVSNGLARRTFLPATWYAPDFKTDPKMSLDNTFRVRLFWIVSRGNNCQYCLGHQEHKLLHAGMTENDIAALDSRWSVFPESEQAALAFARHWTVSPALSDEKHWEALAGHYSPLQLAEISFVVAFYNSVNRWTDGLGLPQDQNFGKTPIELNTPTDPQFAEAETQIVPGGETPSLPWPTRADMEARQQKARSRQARIELVPARELESLWPDLSPEERTRPHVQALALLPTLGELQFTALNDMARGGDLTPDMAVRIAWIAARENRAPYALADAERRWQALGSDPADLWRDADEPLAGPLQTVQAFVRKLSSRQREITDADVESLRQHYSDRQTAQIVYITCVQNWFDRWTEMLRLPIPGTAPALPK